MPYHDSACPYVNFWFAASEGANIASFNHVKRKQPRKITERGRRLYHLHSFGEGVSGERRINNHFKGLMERMASMNGWFVPVRTLLDFILKVSGSHVITSAERNDLERKWLWHKIVHMRGRS
jgi:hypothetical protein